MRKQKLQLFKYLDNLYRAVIKTQHGRIIYLEIAVVNNAATVTDCYYIDRVRSGKYHAAPKKLKTLRFTTNEILSVVENELDRKYFGIDYNYSLQNKNTDEFIQIKLAEMQRKYNFLIFIGEGALKSGIPQIIKTRFKNRIHRSIYLEIRYNGNGKGVISDCHYYDRKYTERSMVVPESLSTVFFDYNRQAILNIINNELNTAFTHIIFVTDKDSGLNIENEIAICGNV